MLQVSHGSYQRSSEKSEVASTETSKVWGKYHPQGKAEAFLEAGSRRQQRSYSSDFDSVRLCLPRVVLL